MMVRPTIEARDLTVSYGDTVAVDGLDIVINQGEKLSIVGKSGCGKTSLLHAFAGLVPISGGSLLMDGAPVTGVGNHTAIILQKEGLFPWKNVEANVRLGIINHPELAEDMEGRLDRVLRQLGIDHLRHRYLKALSGGERQRVAIARAMIQAPELLLMDEPSSSLDMVTKEAFQASIHDLFDETMTAVTVTHDIEEAVYLGERIMILDQGKVLKELKNPYFSQANVRNSLAFYELCLEVRQVMSQ